MWCRGSVKYNVWYGGRHGSSVSRSRDFWSGWRGFNPHPHFGRSALCIMWPTETNEKNFSLSFISFKHVFSKSVSETWLDSLCLIARQCFSNLKDIYSVIMSRLESLGSCPQESPCSLELWNHNEVIDLLYGGWDLSPLAVPVHCYLWNFIDQKCK